MTFDLPNGWKLLSLVELAGIGGLVADGDWVESKDQDPSGHVRLIQLADIGDGEFQDRSARFLTSEKARELRCTMLETGDVLVARMPDPLGRACIFPGVGQPSITAVDIFIWRPGKDAADPRWLMYAINSPQVRTHLQDLAVGATRQRVSGGNLKRLTLPTPPHPLQRRIAATIGELLRRSNSAHDDLSRIPKLLRQYRKAVIDKALRGELTEGWRVQNPTSVWDTTDRTLISSRRAAYVSGRRGSRLRDAPPLVVTGDREGIPDRWISCCFADVVDLRVGYAFKSNWFAARGPKLLRGANVAPGRIDWDDLKCLANDKALEFPEYRLRTGDIVIAMDRPLISSGLKIAILGEDDDGALLVQRVASPTCTRLVEPQFLWMVLNSNLFLDHIGRHATGSDLPHVSGNDILT